MAGAALGAPQARFAWHAQHLELLWTPAAFAWQVQHLEDLSPFFAWKVQYSERLSAFFFVEGAALGAPPERSADIRRRLSTMGAGFFRMAGAELRALQFDLRGRRSTRSISVSFCVAGAALGAPLCRLDEENHQARRGEISVDYISDSPFCSTFTAWPAVLHHQAPKK